MNETSVPKCPRCGAELPANAPEGLCPRCVAANLAAETEARTVVLGAAGTEAARPAPLPAPPPEEIAKLFPQLEILEVLGRGGMGAVYKARQPRLNRIVALKILIADKKSDPQFAERFEREAQTLARLHHPNIVAIYDFGEVAGNFYLLMEFVDGLTLRQLLQTGKLSSDEALTIVPKICEALQYAHHQGIVHRDIKPENILLDKQGQLKIADFGIAKILGQKTDFRLTGARDVMGTPHYMAPEQVEKPQEVDHRADIYSLGVVLYEMLTGELPLGRFEPPSHKAQIDVRLDEVVLRSLAKNPERRYQHVSEVKTEVESIATSSPTDGIAAPKTVTQRPLPRYRVMALTVFNVLLALMLGLIGWAANSLGIFFNALFVFILLMVPVRIALILFHAFQGTLEYELWRKPWAAQLRKYRWQMLNRWLFWLLAVVVLQICVVPAQFTSDQLSVNRALTYGGVVVVMLLELLPARRLYLATNAVFALGSIFMAVQIAHIYWPESKAQGVVLSMPVLGNWLVINGGNSALINIYHNFKEQRNALDIEKLVDGHERTGDGYKLESYPSWGETVYAPADGKVVVVEDDLDDNAVGKMNRDEPVGNTICIDMGNDRYVMMAHLQKGSLKVAEGDTVHTGQPLAKCGNSGNTFHPHLHIQVQDGPRIFVTGKGAVTTYPILFRDASRLRAGKMAGDAPFFVRRNDQIVSGGAIPGLSDGTKVRAP